MLQYRKDTAIFNRSRPASTPCGEIILIHRDYNERNEVLRKFAELSSISLDQETTETTSLASEYPFVVTKFMDDEGDYSVQVFFHDTSLLEDITCSERGFRYNRSSHKTAVQRIDGALLWEIARLRWGFFIHPGRMSAKLRLLVFGFLQNVEIVSGVPLGSGLADFVSLAFLRALALPDAHLPVVGFSLDSVSTHRGGVPGDREMLKSLFRLLFQVPFASSPSRGIELVKIGRCLGLSKFKLPEWMDTSGFPWETPELSLPRPIHRSPPPIRVSPASGLLTRSSPQRLLQQQPWIRRVPPPLGPLTPFFSSNHTLEQTELLDTDIMEVDPSEDTQVFPDAPNYLSQINDDGYNIREEHSELQSTGPPLFAEQYLGQQYCSAIFETPIFPPPFPESMFDAMIAHTTTATTNVLVPLPCSTSTEESNGWKCTNLETKPENEYTTPSSPSKA